MEKLLVFVYGTLKRGEPNHHWLTNLENGQSKFICKGVTKELYPLVVASSFNIPFLLDKPGLGKNIHGEVYEVDDRMLSKLDILEDHPNFYVRRLEDIHVDGQLSSSGIIKALVYTMPSFQVDLLNRSHLDSYSAEATNYVPKEMRDPLVDYKKEVKQ